MKLELHGFAEEVYFGLVLMDMVMHITIRDGGIVLVETGGIDVQWDE